MFFLKYTTQLKNKVEKFNCKTNSFLTLSNFEPFKVVILNRILIYYLSFINFIYPSVEIINKTLHW